MLDNKYSLGFFPTPLEHLTNLSKKYGTYQFYIKRDDNSGLASGGNKVRKLQYLIYDALQKGCGTIITAGAQQSNHCRQTAAACNKAGLECHLLLGGDKPSPYSGNLLLSHLLGANIHFSGDHRKGEEIEELKKKLVTEGRKVYVIPYGGSNLLGAFGFVDAVKELKQQLTDMNLNIDYLFFASSSGGTQAGLKLGIDLYALKIKLMPINIDKKGFKDKSLDEYVLGLLQQGKVSFKIEKQYSINDAATIKGYDSQGYGVVTENEKSVIKELAQTEGILLDPVYSGRAFYGMLDHVKNKMIPEKSNILFWHTGGLPANFYYSEQLMG